MIGVIGKGTVVIYTIEASLALILFTTLAWRLDGQYPGASYVMIASSAALLVFELVGILRAYQKRSENLGKLTRWVFKANIVLLLSAEFVLWFHS